MTQQELTILAERITGMFSSIRSFSIKGQSLETDDCDILIDSRYESRLPSEVLPESVIRYWVEPVPHDESLTRHKFNIANF